MQSTGVRAAASSIRTWPLATNETIARFCRALMASMCGRTGFAPVLAKHIAAAAPLRSIFSGTALALAWPRSSAAPS